MFFVCIMAAGVFECCVLTCRVQPMVMWHPKPEAKVFFCLFFGGGGLLVVVVVVCDLFLFLLFLFRV